MPFLPPRAANLSDIPLKNMDGSPMLDEHNNPVTATVFSPATKVWQVASATKRRKAMKRVREANNKIEAAADDREDVVDFLCAVTKQFNGFAVPEAADPVRAVYEEPAWGYIRDQLADATENWENFTKASQTASASMPASSPG